MGLKKKVVSTSAHGWDFQKVEAQAFEYLCTLVDKTEFDYKSSLENANAKWRVVSSLQKGIRRSQIDHARKCAFALANSGNEIETYLWHRLAVIAIEEIGFINQDLVAGVLLIARNKKLRKELVGDRKEGLPLLAVAVAGELAATCKDRVLCHLNGALFDPRFMPLREGLFHGSDAAVMEIAQNHNGEAEEFLEQLMATKALAGQMKLDPMQGKRYEGVREGNDDLFFELIDSFDLPEHLNYYVVQGKKLGVEGFFTNVPFAHFFWEHEMVDHEIVQDVSENNELIKGLLSCSYDKHVLEGKKAISYYSKVHKPIADWIAKTGAKPVETIGMIVFLLEGGEQLADRVSYPFSEIMLEKFFDAQRTKNGISEDDWAFLLDEVRGSLDILHKSRVRVITGEKI